MSRLARRVQSTPAQNDPAPAPEKPRPIAAKEPYQWFRPFPVLPEKWQSQKAQDRLLELYISDRGDFAAFAIKHDLTIDQLYDWFHSEAIYDRTRRMEEAAKRHAALIARLNRPSCIERLAEIANDPHVLPQRRIVAARSVLRVAEAADTRDERRAREAERASMRQTSSAVSPLQREAAGGGFLPHELPHGHSTNSPANHRVSSPSPTNQTTSPTNPSADRAEPPRQSGSPPKLTLTPNPSTIITRIGPAGSPIPPTSSPRKHGKASRTRPRKRRR